MKYYEDKIRNVEFYGIKYRKVTNINEYNVLEKEVKEIVSCGDKKQFMIEVENMKEQSLEEKDISMTINFSLVSTFLFGIISYVIGALFGTTKSISYFLFGYIVAIVLYMFLMTILVNRARDILRLCNDKAKFFELIRRMIT